MYESLFVTSWVNVRAGSDLTCNIHGDDIVFLVTGGANQRFELVYDAEALRKFVDVGNQALARIETTV